MLLWIWIERRPRLLQTRRAAIDRYRLPMGAIHQPAHRTLLQRANGTDGRTDTVPLHRPCRILCVTKVNKEDFAQRNRSTATSAQLAAMHSFAKSLWTLVILTSIFCRRWTRATRCLTRIVLETNAYRDKLNVGRQTSQTVSRCQLMYEAEDRGQCKTCTDLTAEISGQLLVGYVVLVGGGGGGGGVCGSGGDKAR